MPRTAFIHLKFVVVITWLCNVRANCKSNYRLGRIRYIEQMGPTKKNHLLPASVRAYMKVACLNIFRIWIWKKLFIYKHHLFNTTAVLLVDIHLLFNICASDDGSNKDRRRWQATVVNIKLSFIDSTKYNRRATSHRHHINAW